MTVAEIVTAARTAGVCLEARGDRLHVEAPRGALTPELRDALAQHKPEILAHLAPVTASARRDRTSGQRRFVYLRGGLTVPLPALELALDLERRGFRQTVDAEQQYQIEPAAGMTAADHAAIARWRLHLAAIVSYEAPECA